MVTPRLFYSYSNADDQHDNGAVLKLKAKIEGEFKTQTGGAPLKIVLDKDEIGWGEHWRDKLDSEMMDSLFVIPIFSANFLNSQECRREILRFLEMERVRDRKDLILPIYYETVDSLDGNSEDHLDEDRRTVLQAIRDHQYIDWRSYRIDGFETRDARKTLKDVALRLKQAVARATPRSHSVTSSDRDVVVFDSLSSTFDADLPTAIARLRPGQKIQVNPGTHPVRGFDVSAPIEFVGDDGHPEKCVLEVRAGETIRWNASNGGLRGIHVRAAAGQPAIEFGASKAVLRNCVVEAKGDAALLLHPGANLTLRHCRVRGGRHGISAVHPSQVELEDCEITGATLAGIRAWMAEISIRKTRIHGNAEGVWVGPKTKGVFDGCDLTGNQSGPGYVMQNATVEFRQTKGEAELRRVQTSE